MAVQPITAGALSNLGSTQSVQKAQGSSNFNDILTQAINDAIVTETQDEAGAIALLAGGDTEVHTGMIESTKAEMALNLAIQIRNKALEAYNEVMRMQI